MIKLYTSLFFLILAFQIVTAQSFEVGLSLGVSTYNGDIHVQPQNFKTTIQLVGGIVGKYRLSNSFLLRGQITAGKISASEVNDPTIWRKERGFSFVTKLTQATGALEWSAISIKDWSFYVYGGGGAIRFNPQISYTKPEPRIDPDIKYVVEKRFAIVPTIAAGCGLKYAMDNSFNVALEFGYWFVFSDYLDGISKVGASKRNDMYFLTGISVTKDFYSSKMGFKTGKISCPKF